MTGFWILCGFLLLINASLATSRCKPPIKCGPNSHYAEFISACPFKCGSYYGPGTIRCQAIIEKPSCPCNDGYILKGEKCVKPCEC